MDLIPWQPIRELNRIRTNFERLLAEPLLQMNSILGQVSSGFPVEMLERDQEWLVRAELAGIDPKEVDLRITDDTLTIRGERRLETDEERDGIRRSERAYGAFARTVAFPKPVDAERATATFRNGLLEVRAPKRSPNDGQDGRRIHIDPGSQ